MNAAPDMLMAGLRMIAALAVVLALLLALLYGLRRIARQRSGGIGGQRIRVLESHYLGVKKSISLVRVPGKVLVLGVTGDRITRLDALDEAMVDSEPPIAEAGGFAPMLSERLKGFGWRRKGGDRS